MQTFDFRVAAILAADLYAKSAIILPCAVLCYKHPAKSGKADGTRNVITEFRVAREFEKRSSRWLRIRQEREMPEQSCAPNGCLKYRENTTFRASSPYSRSQSLQRS